MPDVTVLRVEELESADTPGVPAGLFRFAGKSLGVTAWGMNVLSLPPGWDRYPEGKAYAPSWGRLAESR